MYAYAKGNPVMFVAPHESEKYYDLLYKKANQAIDSLVSGYDKFSYVV